MADERIHIRVTSDGAKATRKDIEGLGAGADRASRALGGLGSALKAAIAGAAAREVVRLSDGYTDLSNKVRFATRSEQEMIAVRAELFRSANQNRQAVETTADVYSKLRLSTKTLGLSQREVVELTDTLSKATVLSGASADSAANSLRQLGQGLAAGALRGDELNSVLENTPYIAEVIATSLGKDIGVIRQMGAEGKITSDIIVTAFKGARQEIVENFGKRIPKVSEALEVAGNVVTRLVGEVNDATGASKTLAQTIIDLANQVDGATTEIAAMAKSLSNLSQFKDVVSDIAGTKEQQDDGLSGLRFWAIALAAIQDQIYAIGKARDAVFSGGLLTAEGRGNLKQAVDAVGVIPGAGVGPATQRLMDTFAQLDSPRLGAGFGRAAGTAAPDPLGEKGAGREGSTKSADILAALRREGELLAMSNRERAVAKALDDARKDAGDALTEEQEWQLETQIRENLARQETNKHLAESHKTVGDILKELQQEHGLLQMSNSEREIAEGLLKAQESAKGRLHTRELGLIEAQLRRNNALRVEQDLLDEVNDRLDKQLEIELDIIAAENRRHGERGQAAGARAAEVAAIGAAERQRAQDSTFDGAMNVMGTDFLANVRTVGQELALIFGPGGTLQQGMQGVVGSLSDAIGYSLAFGRSWNDTAEAIQNIGRSIFAEVISGLIRIPIQMGINEAIASGLRAKATAETTAQAATTAAAWAPAAAGASLATAGGNSVGATAAIVGVSALALGALAVAAFEEGGYTGNGGRSDVAGLVHGKEFVLHADATRRYRDEAEAMNAGTWRPGGGGSVSVTIVDQTDGGTTFETRQLSESEIEVIVRRVAPQAVADDLGSPQSRVGRSLSRNYETKRVRA